MQPAKKKYRSLSQSLPFDRLQGHHKGHHWVTYYFLHLCNDDIMRLCPSSKISDRQIDRQTDRQTHSTTDADDRNTPWAQKGTEVKITCSSVQSQTAPSINAKFTNPTWSWYPTTHHSIIVRADHSANTQSQSGLVTLLILNHSPGWSLCRYSIIVRAGHSGDTQSQSGLVTLAILNHSPGWSLCWYSITIWAGHSADTQSQSGLVTLPTTQ